MTMRQIFVISTFISLGLITALSIYSSMWLFSLVLIVPVIMMGF